ncbi:molybdate ABC transporter substrate-binding protein [Spirosoma spitsbergense]|uniref:molybdate ABC transporter substrate-binding protein n=1 Tax=Spirosoma spitsbergense TaxID=431554 RepID=UPI000361A94B|nr:substrate-binding domain-containing protein [Spirosoma spitsbergense]
MKLTLWLVVLLFLNVPLLLAQSTRNPYPFDPPWNTPPQAGVAFTVPRVDNVPDLYGDIVNPQLVVFMGGNQFMVLDELLVAFKKQYPAYTRIFVETLPPGILAQQMKTGSISIGNLRIDHQPDVYLAGKKRVEENRDRLVEVITYARNKLAIMVQKGNPKQIKGLKDLSKPDVRVSMPNPAWEGIGGRIEEAFVKAGGDELKSAIMNRKVADKSTFLTQIHHRQTPMRILYNESDAGPVWYTEAYYQQMLHNPVELIHIPEKENVYADYQGGALKNAPHAQAAADFIAFLKSPTAQSIYKKYGFLPPLP